MKKNFFLIFILSIILIPGMIFSAGFVACDGVDVKCNFNKFSESVGRVIDWVLYMSVIIGSITFTYAGFKMLMNQTNAGVRTDAWNMIRKTIWGLVIVLGSWLFVKSIVSTLVDGSVDALRFLK